MLVLLNTHIAKHDLGGVLGIDVNYVNVNAFYFYFTPILVEIDVKDNFYVFPKGLLFHGFT